MPSRRFIYTNSRLVPLQHRLGSGTPPVGEELTYPAIQAATYSDVQGWTYAQLQGV